MQSYGTRVPLICAQCGKPFAVHPCRAEIARFCCHRCYSASLKRHNPEPPVSSASIIPLICDRCREPFAVLAGANMPRFCSPDCVAPIRRYHGDAPNGNASPEHHAWAMMRSRCNSPSNPGYKDYGGRGITVCERWSSFPNFLADMGRRPSPLHSLDRINNDLGYTPENCRWATKKGQSRNRRSNHLLTYNGETRCLTEWAELRNMTHKNLAERLQLGWSVERALNTPVLQYKKRK